MPKVTFANTTRRISIHPRASQLQQQIERRRKSSSVPSAPSLRSWLGCFGLHCGRVHPEEEARYMNGIRVALRRNVVNTVASVAFNSDQLVPLNEREILQILTTWKPVQKEFADTGTRMFLKMFDLTPGVVKTFEKFRSLGDTELETSNILEAHGLVVMNAFDEIICNLDDEELVHEMMLEQGRSHARFGDELTEDAFWAMEEPFLFAVGQTVGGLTPSMERLFKKTVHYILSMCVAGFRMEMSDREEQASIKAMNSKLPQGQIASCSHA